MNAVTRLKATAVKAATTTNVDKFGGELHIYKQDIDKILKKAMVKIGFKVPPAWYNTVGGSSKVLTIIGDMRTALMFAGAYFGDGKIYKYPDEVVATVESGAIHIDAKTEENAKAGAKYINKMFDPNIVTVTAEGDTVTIAPWI